MKIADVRAVPLAVPMRESAPVASAWAAGLARQLLVRVTTDEGLVGWGECFAYGATLAVANVVDDALAPVLVGQDPTAIEPLLDRMERLLMIWGRRGLAMMAVSGVELALWDLAGKARGAPVWALLGGNGGVRVPAYASLLRYATPSEVGRAATAMASAGFRGIKLHQTDVESVAVAREAVGDDVALMLDTNCPWSVEAAIRIGRRLEKYDLAWLEEPVWPPEDYAGLARVRAAVRVPIACGENEATAVAFRQIVEAGAADIVQPSITKVGGLIEMRRAAAVAAAANVTLVPHSFYFGPGLAATLHVVAATPGVPWIEFPPGRLDPPLLEQPIVCVDGHVAPPAGPGLGADPDPGVLARHAYQREGARPLDLT